MNTCIRCKKEEAEDYLCDTCNRELRVITEKKKLYQKIKEERDKNEAKMREKKT